jgi:hypothetical protein
MHASPTLERPPLVSRFYLTTRVDMTAAKRDA